MFSTSTLSRNNITEIIVRTARITITRLTTVSLLRQSKIFGETLIAITSNYVSLASTFSSDHVTTLIVDGTEGVAGARFAAVRIASGEVPIAVFAQIASSTLHVRLAVATSSDKAVARISYRITDSAIERTMRITITC